MIETVMIWILLIWLYVVDMQSSCCAQPKIPSPNSSATSKGEPKVSLVNEGMTNIQEIADGERLSLLHNRYLSK